MIRVPLVKLPGAEDMPLPGYATPGAAGMDLMAAIEEPLVIEPGRFALVPTGIRIALPDGFEGQVRPRSGLAAKHGLTVLNAPGTIDSDYRGEIKVILINLGDKPARIERGNRIAQLVVARVERVEWAPETDLAESLRGGGGFGHTGE